jgi:hypothetical protein
MYVREATVSTHKKKPLAKPSTEDESQEASITAIGIEAEDGETIRPQQSHRDTRRVTR